ncbi:MAG TPA: flavodoxin domain-containing protein [Gaiellaceae bacterium]|nr:flavodoxin domain-containing protein [Gaiellaceae bacterium]
MPVPPLILVVYATEHGCAGEVAREVAARLAARGLAADVRRADDAVTLDGYRGAVLGSAVDAGGLHRDARRFLRRHRDRLAELPAAVFGMRPGPLEPEQAAASHRQLDAALAREPALRPFSTALFAGASEPSGHRFPFDPMPPSDVPDRDAVDTWADEVAERLLRLGAAA